MAGDRPLSAGFYTRLRHRHASRRARLRGLQSNVDANRNPVQVTGDCNSTLAMRDLQGLSRRLANANHATRRLYPSSWPASCPALWQLDWTFTSGVEVHRYDLLDPRGMSDHRVQALLVSIEGVTR